MVWTDEDTDPSDVRNNRLHTADRAFHDWYRFVLSFPPHLVRDYIEVLGLSEESMILDPFCGTGTTLVEAKKHGIRAIGVEAIPMSYLASTVKTTWDLGLEKIETSARIILEKAVQDYWDDVPLKALSDEQYALLLKNSIGTLPLHKCLLLLERIEEEQDQEIRNFYRLALAYVAVKTASNLRFGPEVSIRRRKKQDADVFEHWYARVLDMLADLKSVRDTAYPKVTCHWADSRCLSPILAPESIDAIITSPPYPNEKDYTRTTRLESVILGLLSDKRDLRSLKQHLIRSNSRNVYTVDKDDLLISPNSKVCKIADEIERRRIALNKTSGFERVYSRVVKLYFGGMKRHLEELKPALKPGAKLAYVVGDQASYLQVLIKTGELLAEIAEELEYQVCGIDLFRTRMSTATGEQLREEVLVLEWKG